MHPLIQNNVEQIQALCKQHHVKTLYVFGSVATPLFNENSDVDFLYEMDYTGIDFNDLKNMPFDPVNEFFYMKEELEQLLGRKVDLVPNQNFRNKYFLAEVNKTKQLLYTDERYSQISA